MHGYEKRILFILEVGLEIPKKNRNWQKMFVKNLRLKLWMDLYLKSTKQGRDEETEEHYPTTE